MLKLTLFPGYLVTIEITYDSLATMRTTLSNLKHNTSPAIDGGTFASVPQPPSSHAPPTVTAAAPSIAPLQRRNLRTGQPDISHGVLNISFAHSRMYSFSVNYGLWPFDGRDYVIVYTVTNNMVNTDLSLWTPLFTEDTRRHGCMLYSGCWCNNVTTEHSLRKRPAPFRNVSSLLNLEIGAYCPDGFVFETWELPIGHWHRLVFYSEYQGNGTRNVCGSGRFHSSDRGHNLVQSGINAGTTHVVKAVVVPTRPTQVAPNELACPASAADMTPHSRIIQIQILASQECFRYSLRHSVTARRRCHHTCSAVYDPEPWMDALIQ